MITRYGPNSTLLCVSLVILNISLLIDVYGSSDISGNDISGSKTSLGSSPKDVADLPELDPSQFIVTGPGLEPRATLPVRYIFVQLVTKSSVLVTRSLGKQVTIIFSLHIADSARSPIRVWHDILDLQDGTYVIRFRLLQSLTRQDAQINLSIGKDKQPIAKSPYILRKPLYAEHCNCPQGNLTAFLDNVLQCKPTYPQIDKDFAVFSSKKLNANQVGNQFNKLYESRGPQALAACRYIVRNDNSIYRKCYGEHIGFRMFSDEAILSMAHKTRLPSMDFVMNLGDWPLVSLSNVPPLPVVSWCGSDTSSDIVIPTYDTMGWVLDMMTRVTLDVFFVLADPRTLWSNKKDIAFWRGRDSSQERMDLVRYSLRNPDKVDARLTNMFFFKNDSTVGEKSPHVPFTDFFNHKYLLQLDGTVAAYRMALLLAGNSTVLKQASGYYEHFYSDLKPNRHFVPLKSDLSDLEDRLAWVRDHQEEAQKVAKASREYVRHHLLPVDVLCYYGRVLERLGKTVPLEGSDDIVRLVNQGFEPVTKSEHGEELEDCECVKTEKRTTVKKSKEVREDL